MRKTGIRNGAIMKPTEFSTDTIVALLRNQTIALLPEVMAALGPGASRRTAFRRLKDLTGRNSYSHRGGFYTLDELVDFDENGLWSFAGVRFSRLGTLIATTESFINHAEAGHFVEELDNLLRVGTHDALRKLVNDERLTRHTLAGHFSSTARPTARTRRHQLSARRLLMATPGLVRPPPDADLMPGTMFPIRGDRPGEAPLGDIDLNDDLSPEMVTLTSRVQVLRPGVRVLRSRRDRVSGVGLTHLEAGRFTGRRLAGRRPASQCGVRARVAGWSADARVGPQRCLGDESLGTHDCDRPKCGRHGVGGS